MKLRLLGLCVLLLVIVQPAAAVMHFSFDCANDRYISKPVGTQWQFRAPIQGVGAGSHPVEITFEPHYPGTWFAQWCQHSTGLCYYDSGQIVLNGALPDRLEIDFFPDPTTPGMGWVDLTIRSLEDPAEVVRCTYTLYSGLPVSAGNFSYDWSDNTRWLDEGGYFEFYSPLANHLSVPDTLMVRVVPTMPIEWNMHFCHQGICYYPYGEFRVMPNEPDSLTIMCTVGEGPANGGVTMILQSKRNPSLAAYAGYWAYVREPEGVETAVHSSEGDLRVLPNPSSDQTTFLFRRALDAAGGLTIYRADGRVVRELSSAGGTGVSGLRWDGRDAQDRPVPPGIYFYRWQAGSEVQRGTLVRAR